METFNKYFENITDLNVADTILSKLTPEEKETINKELSVFVRDTSEGNTPQIYEYVKAQTSKTGGSRRRRRPSRKYKKSAKRVFRKKSRSTRRR
jgi:hypothetical protein